MARHMKKTRQANKENKRPKSKRPAPNRPKKLRQWSNESMLRAIEAVKNGEMGQNRAALEYGVPRTTLKDRLSGRVVHGTNIGPKPYLTKEEEKELVDFLITCSKMGYGKTRSEVLKIVEAAVQKKGIKSEGNISQGWWNRFRERWPQLSLRKGDSFPIVREQMTCREVFESYFSLLKETLEKYDLMDKPSQVYNCDESGMPLEHKQPKTLALKGTKKVRQCTSGNKTQITVLGCVSAAGQVMPPMVVFSGKNFNHTLSEGEVPGTFYGMSDSGWMDQELFASWFSCHFLEHAVSSRPLMLILDGHSSHFTLDLVQSAAEHQVIIFCLPPHTTADSQPLDTSCFGPLKSYWYQACRDYMFANPGRVITKFQFSHLFAQAWSKGMTINNITAGFRNTGIYPFNPGAILDKINSGDDPAHQEPELEPQSESELETTRSPTGENSDSSNPLEDSSVQGQFSSESIRLFEERFANGYDIYTDHEYVAWLEQFHPESLPSFANMFSELPPLDSPHTNEYAMDPFLTACNTSEHL